MPLIVVENCYDVVSNEKKPREIFFPGELASPDVAKHDEALFATYDDEHPLSWFAKLMTYCEISLENLKLRQALSHSYIHQQYLLDHLYDVFLHSQSIDDPLKRQDFISHFKAIFLDGIAFCTPGLHGRLAFFVCRMQALNNIPSILTSIRQDLVLEAVNLVNHSVHHFAKFNNSIPDVPKILETDPYAHLVSEQSLLKFQTYYFSLQVSDYNGYALLLRILRKIKEQCIVLGYQGRHQSSYRIQEFEAIHHFLKTILADETLALADVFVIEEETDGIIDVNWAEVLLRLIHCLHYQNYLLFNDIELSFLSHLFDTTELQLEEKYHLPLLFPNELIPSQGLLLQLEFVPQYLALMGLVDEIKNNEKIASFKIQLNRYVFVDYIESKQMSLLEQLPLRTQLILLEKNSSSLMSNFDYQMIYQIHEYFPFSCVEKLLFIEPLKALHIILKALQSKLPKQPNFDEFLRFLFLNYMLENAGTVNWAYLNQQQQTLLLQSCLTFTNFLQSHFMLPVINQICSEVLLVKDRKGHDLVDYYINNAHLDLRDLAPIMQRLKPGNRYELIFRLDEGDTQLKKELIHSLSLGFLAEEDGDSKRFKKVLNVFPGAIDFVWPLLRLEPPSVITSFIARQQIYQSESFENVPWHDLRCLFEKLDEHTLFDLFSQDLFCSNVINHHLDTGPQVFDDFLRLMHLFPAKKVIELQIEIYRQTLLSHAFGAVFFEFFQSNSPHKNDIVRDFVVFMFEEWVLFSNLYDKKILISFTLNHFALALSHCFDICDSGLLIQLIGFLKHTEDFPEAQIIFVDFMFKKVDEFKELDIHTQVVIYEFLISYNVEQLFKFFSCLDHHHVKLFLHYLDEKEYYQLKTLLIGNLISTPAHLLRLESYAFLEFYYFLMKEHVIASEEMLAKRDEILALTHIWEVPELQRFKYEIALDIVLSHPQQALIMLNNPGIDQLILSMMIKNYFESRSLSLQLDFIDAYMYLEHYYAFISDILFDIFTKFLIQDDEPTQQRVLLRLASPDAQTFINYFSAQVNHRITLCILLETWLEKENLNGFELLRIFAKELNVYGELKLLTEKCYSTAFQVFSTPLSKLFFWQSYQHLQASEQVLFVIKPEVNYMLAHLLHCSSFEKYSFLTYLRLYYGEEVHLVPEVQNLAENNRFQYLFDDVTWRKIKIELCKRDLQKLVEHFYVHLISLLPRSEPEIMPFWREYIAPHKSLFSSFCIFNPKHTAISNLQVQLNEIYGEGYSA